MYAGISGMWAGVAYARVCALCVAYVAWPQGDTINRLDPLLACHVRFPLTRTALHCTNPACLLAGNATMYSQEATFHGHPYGCRFWRW
jgi:hypothetical protein